MAGSIRFRMGPITLLLSILLVHSCRAEKPYSVELNTFTMDDTIENQENWVDWGTLSMKKVSRNQFVVSGDFEFKLNMADEQKIVLMVYVYDSNANQRGSMVMAVKKPFCQFIKEDEDSYPSIQKASNLPDQDTCPFPKGKYTIDNYELETNFLPDNAPKGDYLLQLSLLDREVPVAGLVATVTLT
nr:CheA7a-RA [synthetic construct]